MGAKFAPSIARLFMAEWEEDSVFKNAPVELVVYKRYIDDVFILWKGDIERLTCFLEELNRNNKNITLTWDISNTKATFLDLEILQDESGFSSQTHFKDVDRNSYLPIESCHHKNWLYNVPKGQLVRLRCNCTQLNTFLDQADKLTSRFSNKGYGRQFIEEKVKEFAAMDRIQLIKDVNKHKKPLEGAPLILDFSAQHKKVEKIIKNHWHILLADKQFQGSISLHPHFIYKRGPTIRDKVVKNVIDPPKRTFSFFTGKGFFPCRRCFACSKTMRANLSSHQQALE